MKTNEKENIFDSFISVIVCKYSSRCCNFSTLHKKFRNRTSFLSKMQKLLNKTINDKYKQDQLRILIEMLVVTPKTFNNSIDEIMDIMELLKKDYSDINAYKKIDELITSLNLCLKGELSVESCYF
ncbi:MAG TPA: hypothetical protein PK566_05640 [Pseudobacteroides sp.]|nr:hypothetical protein [Pseudobacteroides sp.]